MSGDALTSLFSGLGLSNQQQAQHAFSAGQALAGSISYPAGPQQQQASPGAGFNFSPANSPNPFEPLPAAFPSPTGLPGVLSPAAHDNHPFSPQSASPASVVASPTAFGTSLGSSGAGSPGPRQRPTFMFGRPLAQREAQEQQPQPSAHHQLLELEAPFPVHPQHPQHQQSLRSDSIHTSALTLISHEHGRQRRAERGISRRQLQEAVKYGIKEPANPGVDGRTRWRYTYQGVVYVTDESSRHEITSWRLQPTHEVAPAALAEAGGEGQATAHVVLIVDMSGSMRKNDVPGFSCRSHAVYECLARDLVEPQLRDFGSQGIQVSLIEMSSDAHLVLQRQPLSMQLLRFLHERGATQQARSHGHYIPALTDAERLLQADLGQPTQLFLVFLSDGAPSDHKETLCSHGIMVWQADEAGARLRDGRAMLRSCAGSGDDPKQAQQCRAQVKEEVQQSCVRIVQRIGQTYGTDRVQVHCVAFGPPDEDYGVLKAMAGALPRGTFQTLGLSAINLQAAFTSLSSTLGSLRSEALASRLAHSLTLRHELNACGRASRMAYSVQQALNPAEWDYYFLGDGLVSKHAWDPVRKALVPQDLTPCQHALPGPICAYGVAHSKQHFGRGAERYAFQFTEVVATAPAAAAAPGLPGPLPQGPAAPLVFSVGQRMVSKQPKYLEQLADPDFDRTFLRIQGQAAKLAHRFNQQLDGPHAWQVRFLPCWLYTLRQSWAPSGVIELAVEEELDGAFTKWNNNTGSVARSLHRGLRVQGAPRLAPIQGLGTILEAEEEEEEEGSEEEDEDEAESRPASTLDVMQCFPHFTYVASGGRKLVCDLQGTWNATDGFTLTDPVIHHASNSRRNGATDKGQEGMRAFFRTHTCNMLCRRLGLEGTRLL